MRLYWPTIDMMLETPGAEVSLALCLDPSWFPCLGPPPRGGMVLDTGSLEGEGFEGRGVVFQQGPGEPEIAVFVFDGGTLAGPVRLCGQRPAALLFRGAARITARIDARLAGARREGPGLAAAPGAGGGFGGRGGAADGCNRGAPSYGIAAAFEVGSGGQRGAAPGGLGGGGLQLGATGPLELEGAHIDVGGGGGASPSTGIGGGGGSGGALILQGAHVRLDERTWLSVSGGDGGDGSRGGGGGAGGYVLGATDPAGIFDPRGAQFAIAGGRGGRSACGGGGSDGGHGVVYLAVKRGAGFRSPKRNGASVLSRATRAEGRL